ncbi:MAG: c-type cytochrome [Gammaproteobacteria bacterium]|nr:c-type cytochrome [Gammaproteobacteria bacterium]
MPRLDNVLKAVGALALVGAIVAAAVPLLGLVSITASSGHWAITDVVLHGAMRRAVATQSLGIEPPPLSDIAMIAEGAGHFEIGCAPCHGRPGAAPPPIPEGMTPPPPYLPPRIEEWKPRELFFIVKHGVKFTGMPAWAAQRRDDEVWSVVAFLLALPELDPESYLQLAYGELADSAPALTGFPGGISRDATGAEPAAPDAGAALPAEAAVCARCHGIDGRGRGLGAFPRLAGFPGEYLHATLESYASGIRDSGIMEPVAASLDAESMRRVAAYYAEQPAAGAAPAEPAAPPAARREDEGPLALGRRIATEGFALRGVAPCAYCHGPDPVARNPLFPDLAGQPQRYLARQLEQWTRGGGRGGTEYAEVMYEAARRLEPDEIDAVAQYYASLPTQP